VREHLFSYVVILWISALFGTELETVASMGSLITTFRPVIHNLLKVAEIRQYIQSSYSQTVFHR
jgi:hypothetical protein